MPFPGVFRLIETFQFQLLGPGLRRVGKALIAAGNQLGGDTISHHHLQPNPSNLSIDGLTPKICESAFVGRNTVVAGNVDIAPHAFILYNNIFKAVGPGSRIHLEEGVYVMDHAHIKADGGNVVHIGHKSIISSHAILHNCEIGKGGFVGPAATVKPGARISDYAGLAAGSVLQSGDVIPTRQYWAGNPAQYLREITEEEVEYFKDIQENYDKLRDIYMVETEKPGAIYSIDPEVFPQTYDDENTVEADEYFEMLQPVMKDLHFSMARGEARQRAIREEKFEDNDTVEFKQKDILYDGTQSTGPAYLNEFRRTNQVENEIKKNLEYDPERTRMRKEDFEQKRQQPSDFEFKRKF
jgi:carbonic anhydrase/acetyltransferase-like protein (isoleucine patch superfamily)